jgi:hypothetical protein
MECGGGHSPVRRRVPTGKRISLRNRRNVEFHATVAKPDRLITGNHHILINMNFRRKIVVAENIFIFIYA